MTRSWRNPSHGYYSDDKRSILYLSIISKACPPPLATQVNGSSAQITGIPVEEEINLSNSDYTDDQSDLINMQFNLPYVSTIVPDSQGGFSVNAQPRHSTEYFSYNIDSLNNWRVNIDSDPISFTQNGPNDPDPYPR